MAGWWSIAANCLRRSTSSSERVLTGKEILPIRSKCGKVRAAGWSAATWWGSTKTMNLYAFYCRDGGPDIRVMGCNFFDPDGILIELNQILE